MTTQPEREDITAVWERQKERTIRNSPLPRLGPSSTKIKIRVTDATTGECLAEGDTPDDYKLPFLVDIDVDKIREREWDAEKPIGISPADYFIPVSTVPLLVRFEWPPASMEPVLLALMNPGWLLLEVWANSGETTAYCRLAIEHAQATERRIEGGLLALAEFETVSAPLPEER